jgi:hypothetical protein
MLTAFSLNSLRVAYFRMGGGGSMGMNKVRFAKCSRSNRNLLTCERKRGAEVNINYQGANPPCLHLFTYTLATVKNIGRNGRRVSQRIGWCAEREERHLFVVPLSVNISRYYVELLAHD